MKEITFVATLIAAFFVSALTVPAMAGDVTQATTAAACSQAGGDWSTKTGKCSKKKVKRGKRY